MLITPNDGVNEREPTLIADGALQDTDGAEYRVGEIGLFQARGRDLSGTISGVTGIGLYEAGFDGSSGFVVAHAGASYYAAPIASVLTFTAIYAAGSTCLPVVGAHYASRHYTANGATNRRIELVSAAAGLSTFPLGMSTSTYAVGVSLTQGAGTISAATGLAYWVTEYDSARGIESLHGSTAHTGAFSLLNSIIVTATGTSANSRADTIRWYRSVDGGGYPDGGLIRETAIGTTQITDTLAITGTLTVPLYGIVSVGGLDTDRDETPPVLNTIFGPFQDSLLGVAAGDLRTLRFTPAGYPDSWPSQYGLPIETERNDEIITGVVMAAPARIGVFCKDSVHLVSRLPRDSDSIFAAGEMQELVTNSRGCISRRGACVFTPPGSGGLAAFVSRDGIWASTLATSPVPLTDHIDWNGRVSIADLPTCRLLDDPINRRLVFKYRRATDTTYDTGLWYLDYQEYAAKGIRVTFADHGPLADLVSIVATDGNRRLVSIDSRSANGQVYLESTQDTDDSQLLASNGAVRFRMRIKEFMPAGPRGAVQLGKATWMHDAGPALIEHRFYFNRRDDNPEVKVLPTPASRNADDVVLGRTVNSCSLEIMSVGTTSYGVHWIDIEGLEVANLAAMKGA